MTGCFYHLSQNIYRKVQSKGLQQLYSEDADVAMTTRKLPEMAYVPVNRVIDTFELLVDDIPDVIRPVLYDRVADVLPRTNNAVEGFHNHMQSSVMSCHPNIWAFIKMLQLEQGVNDVTLHITQMIAGRPPPPQRRQYHEYR